MTGAPVAVAPPPAEPGAHRRDPLATRRPVGTFVALFVAAGLLLGTVALTGAGNPRLEVPGWSVDGPSPAERVWSIEIRNAGLAPVEVEAVTWSAHGLARAELVVGRSGLPGHDRDDTRPFAPFTLDGGESRIVALRGTVSCRPGAVVPVSVERSVLHVRSALGRRHDVEVGPGPFADPGPVESVACP